MRIRDIILCGLNLMNKYLFTFPFLVSLLLLVGCEENTVSIPDVSPGLRITLVTSIGGNGDNGYNDLILSGIMRYYHNHEEEVNLSMRHPKSEGEVRVIIQEWMANDKIENGEDTHSLLILASNSYQRILNDIAIDLDSTRRILFFESDAKDLGDGVCTFRINRYGASCLAGLMAEKSPEAHIISANPDNELLLDAEQGFYDGFLFASDGKIPSVEYLADNESGFSMPEKAYDMVKELEEVFIYPLAGGSNNGIYRYSREDFFTLQLIAGMDIDCSDFSSRIPYSVVIHIDTILLRLLEEWHSTGELPSHIDFYMGEGAEIIINPLFLARANIFLDYYSDAEYWQNQKEKWEITAKEMERRYYEK